MSVRNTSALASRPTTMHGPQSILLSVVEYTLTYVC